jgi:hypothetical protein
LPLPRSGESRNPMRWSRRRTMRISQYVAWYFFDSRKAAAPSFSRSADGVFDSPGAPNRLVANAAELARNSLRVSILRLVYKAAATGLDRSDSLVVGPTGAWTIFSLTSERREALVWHRNIPDVMNARAFRFKQGIVSHFRRN